MLETSFIRPREGTVGCGRRSSSNLGRSTCCGVPRQSRRRLPCRKRTKRPRPRRTARTSSGRTDGRSWDSTTRMALSARVVRRDQARRLSLGKPSREPQQTPASSGGWRSWLDTVLASAAKNSHLAQLIASATADNLQFSRRVFLHQQFLFRRG